MAAPSHLSDPRLGMEPHPMMMHAPPPFFQPPPPPSTNPTCNHCKTSKIRCERIYPCSRCIRLNLDCRPQPKRRRGQAAPAEHDGGRSGPWLQAAYVPTAQPMPSMHQPPAPFQGGQPRASVYPMYHPAGADGQGHVGPPVAHPAAPMSSLPPQPQPSSLPPAPSAHRVASAPNAEEALNEFLRECSWDEGAATCAAVWKRGQMEMLCNDRFASMYISRSSMEQDLVEGEIGPASMWARVIARGSRDAFHDGYHEACQMALRDQYHDFSKFLLCVDRFGLETICLIRLQAHASTCNMYTAIIMHIKPTPSPRDVVFTMGNDQQAAAAPSARQLDQELEGVAVAPQAKRSHIGQW